MSTIEVEYITYFHATLQAIWMKHFIAQLRVVSSIHKPTRIYCDNKVVKFSNNNKSSSAYKHIEIQFLAMKERIKDQLVSIDHIGLSIC